MNIEALFDHVVEKTQDILAGRIAPGENLLQKYGADTYTNEGMNLDNQYWLRVDALAQAIVANIEVGTNPVNGLSRAIAAHNQVASQVENLADAVLKAKVQAANTREKGQRQIRDSRDPVRRQAHQWGGRLSGKDNVFEDKIGRVDDLPDALQKYDRDFQAALDLDLDLLTIGVLALELTAGEELFGPAAHFHTQNSGKYSLQVIDALERNGIDPLDLFEKIMKGDSNSQEASVALSQVKKQWHSKQAVKNIGRAYLEETPRRKRLGDGLDDTKAWSQVPYNVATGRCFGRGRKKK